MQARKSTLILPKFLLSFLSAIFLASNLALANDATPNQGISISKSSKNQEAQANLIASFHEDKLIAGFALKLKPGWKIYAPDPGKTHSSIGIAPTFNFSESRNINIEEIKTTFPKAKIAFEEIADEKLEYYIYENEVTIPFLIKVQDPTKPSIINLSVNYGLCRDICIPASHDFTLNIAPGFSDRKILAQIVEFLPKNDLSASIIASIEEYVAPGTTIADNNAVKISLLKALFIAFIGGIILNFMPCVLPVLSVKLISIINHSGAKNSHIRLAFLSTIAGITSSFLIFALIASLLKSLGSAVGWGLQFQNPFFLIFLLLILVIFIANLLGNFEVHLDDAIGANLSDSINRKINKSQNHHIFLPNFLSGVLAVLLATPCSAPFVGVAISFALSAAFSEIFLTFFFMSLGLALPYIILLAFPKMIKFLPKPGKWMIRVKQIMAGFLAATMVWIACILASNIGFIPAIIATILTASFLVLFKICQQKKVTKKIKIPIFLLLAALTFIIPTQTQQNITQQKIAENSRWIKFDEDKISQYLQDRKIVVIDITADWCITCKANKFLVLNSDEITKILAQENVIAMRGDLTKPNEEIINFIKKYDRYGIPFNIIFGPNAPQGILTAEILDKKSFIKAINDASQ